MRMGINAALGRVVKEKDTESQVEGMRADLYQTSHCLDHAARMAMAVLLAVRHESFEGDMISARGWGMSHGGVIAKGTCSWGS